ncbi:MAG: nitrous oxidase accessory protein [Phycisphaerales bacterium]
MIRMLSILVLMLASGVGLGAPPQRSTEEISARIASAEPGGTVSVEAGVYVGNLVIDRSIVLVGEAGAVIDGGGKGTVIEVIAPGVTVRGLTVRGSGKTVGREYSGIHVTAPDAVIEHNTLEDVYFGIDLKEAPRSIIRHNTITGKDLEQARRGDGIRLWWCHGSTVEDNTVRQSRDMVFWYSEDLRIARNSVEGCRYGLHFMYSHRTTLEANELTGNSVGIYLMYSNEIHLVNNRMLNNRGASGYGIGLKDCDGIVVEGNTLLANRVGIYLDNSPSSVDSVGLVAGNSIAYNEIGLLATPNTHDNVITGNAFVENEEQAATHGRGELSRNTFAKEGVGNFWSDYAGFDGDGDGIGDLAYEPRSLFSALLSREPNLRLFAHSPAQQAVEFTARALPELRPRPTLVDPAPLTRRPQTGTAPAAVETTGGPMAALGFGLIAFSAVCWVGLGREPGPGRVTRRVAA